MEMELLKVASKQALKWTFAALKKNAFRDIPLFASYSVVSLDSPYPLETQRL
jgi:hypothetical protein